MTVGINVGSHLHKANLFGVASACSSEVTKSGLSSGLLIDWLEHLDPEVTSVCPDLQQKLLFALNKVRQALPADNVPLMSYHSGVSVCVVKAMHPFSLFVLFQARGTPAYRPYLLALLTHQSNWSTLLQCISALLSKRRDYKYTIF